MRPVYMINGFLESGKSEFITYTLSQPYFQSKNKTLLILCEEGEVEYEPQLLEDSKTVVELIENEEDFTPEKLSELDKKHKPGRVIIEFNGMWNCKNIKLPWYWNIEQQITTIDASSFAMFYSNMKSLLNEMIKKSELIIFNRCDGIEEKTLSSYRRNVKAVNQKAEIVFEDSNGEVNSMFEEDLPYDLNQDVIQLDNMSYSIFFLDVMDHIDRYVGKKLKYVAQVMKPDDIEKGCFIPGRMAMTCCADDIQFFGYLARYKDVDKLNDRDWIEITVRFGKEKRPEYEGNEGPILDVLELKSIKPLPPKEQVLSLT